MKGWSQKRKQTREEAQDGWEQVRLCVHTCKRMHMCVSKGSVRVRTNGNEADVRDSESANACERVCSGCLW